jgi:YbbR domain-containing protein
MRRRIFGHLGLKVLSLALATLVWWMVAGQREAERSLRAPLEFRSIPDQLELVGEPPGLVDVRLRGTTGALAQLQMSEVVAVLDLKGARPGRRLFHILPGDVSVPTGIKVLQVTPATLSLTFEGSAARTVPVVPDIDDEPALGFEVGRVMSDPSLVEVTGPASAVSRVTEATTEPISIRGATQTVVDTVTVGVGDSSVRLRSQRTAVVTIEVRPAPVERVVDHVPVELRNPGARLKSSASPREVTVRLRGPAKAVSALRATDLKAYADLSGLGRGRYNLPVRFDPPQEMTITGVAPTQLDVRIR